MLKPPYEITKRFEGEVITEHQNGSTTGKSKGVNVCLSFEAQDDTGHQYATWELWSDDESIYGEGGIHIDITNTVYDYDGCFSLAKEIIYLLKELGYDTEELDDNL
jgi:hypothetical protein